jgi:hypothetical protein
MTIDPQNVGGTTAGLIDRVKNIILTPAAEFDRIDAEPADVNKIYTGYVLPLAVVVAVCGFIGMSLIGLNVFGVPYKTPIVAGLVSAVLRVVMVLAGTYVIALITNALAPNFGSQANVGKAHQLAAYGSTAGLLSGVFAIIPALSILAIVGLYSAYLWYVGLGKLMKTPDDKRIIYLVVIIIVAIVVWFVIGAVIGAVQMSMGGGVPGMPANPY